MDESVIWVQSLWIDIALFCSLESIGKLRSTCKYLNEILSSNTLWKKKWRSLCAKYQVKDERISLIHHQSPVPRLYLNLCYRLLASHRTRRSDQWFVIDPDDDIESFNIVKDLRSFSYFDSSQLRRKAESSRVLRLRSAFSTIIPVRKQRQCTAPFVDALTDLVAPLGCARGDDGSYSELWPFEEKDRNIFHNHRIAMLIRKKRNWKEGCLGIRRHGKTCGVPEPYCTLNLLGSGWRIQRRDREILGGKSGLGSVTSHELRCRIHEMLKPGIVADAGSGDHLLYLKSLFSLTANDQDLQETLDLFFRVLGCTCLITYNLAFHVSVTAQAETCLVIESYNTHTVVTPIVDSVVCSDMVRCKQVGFSHVTDYLILCLNLKNACQNTPQIKASSFMLSTNPERMKLAFSFLRDLRAVLWTENTGYSDVSQLGCTHTGSTLQVRNSTFGVFKGIDSCNRSEFLVYLATEYMYKCLDLVTLVLELLVQFEWPVVRRLLNRIFMVGENTRIWGFRERFCKDLSSGLDGIAAVLGRDLSRTQRWNVNCVHAEVEEDPTLPFADIFGKADYIIHGPDFF